MNTVLPALLAGNAVIQKPSPQTPLVAEHLQEYYEEAGLPPGLLQTIHLGTLSQLEDLVARPEITHVAFTGSVAGGAAVQKAAATNSFKGSLTHLCQWANEKVCVWSWAGRILHTFAKMPM
jgi:acyl-CoA reductase-like NAD-dependent aldehyde dehydrogenase